MEQWYEICNTSVLFDLFGNLILANKVNNDLTLSNALCYTIAKKEKNIVQFNLATSIQK